MREPIALTDPAAREPDLVGHKTAMLAEAVAAGLPALPGVALPLDASAAAIATGVETLARAGRAAAYLAVSMTEPDGEALEALSAVDPSMVVRSSTIFDADGRWSGAFASYLDVTPEDLPAAVRGCWASAFTRDALERCSQTGTDPSEMRVGVLVQPWRAFDFGGTARVLADDAVVVTVARGGPQAVVTGRGATTAVIVDPKGPIVDDEGVPSALATEVAQLALGTLATTGIGTVEWGANEGEVALLQVGPRPEAVPDRQPVEVRMPVSVPPEIVRAAEVVSRFPGALGEELVIPWALAGETPSGVVPLEEAASADAMAAARSIADRLIADAWGRSLEDARAVAASTIRRLRAGAFLEAAGSIRSMRPPVEADARRVVGLLAGVGKALAARGALPAEELVWQLSSEQLQAALHGQRPVLRHGPDRWEPLVAEITLASGNVAHGTPVVSGAGAGRLHRLDALRSIGRPGPRSVLATPLPLPQLAPLLWHCAGLVTAGGSEGAHLFEVARSLGVPTVIGIDGSALGTDGTVVAVDGSSGRVASLTAQRSPLGASS